MSITNANPLNKNGDKHSLPLASAWGLVDQPYYPHLVKRAIFKLAGDKSYSYHCH
jgi:hypothetical protein